MQLGTQTKDVVDTRWVLTWNEVDGAKAVEARLAPKAYQGPDLRDGDVDTARCVSRRSSHLQLTSLVVLNTREIWRLDIEHASPQADGFGRNVYVRPPCEWNPEDTRRVRKLEAPTYGHNGAPGAFYRPLRKYFVYAVISARGIRFELSSFGP